MSQYLVYKNTNMFNSNSVLFKIILKINFRNKIISSSCVFLYLESAKVIVFIFYSMTSCLSFQQKRPFLSQYIFLCP